MPPSSDNRLWLELDGKRYLPGDRLKGIVYFSCTAPVTVKSFQVQLTGAELAHYLVDKHSTETTTRYKSPGIFDPPGVVKNKSVEHRSWTEKKTLQDTHLKGIVNIPVGNEQKTLAPGQYEAYFAFDIPNNVPASFTWERDRGGPSDDSILVDASISYSVSATIIRKGMFQSNLEASVGFTVLPTPPDALAATGDFDGEATYHGCCSARGGYASAKLQLTGRESSGYAPGDDMQPADTVVVVNSSHKVKFCSMKVQLRQMVEVGGLDRMVELCTENMSIHVGPASEGTEGTPMQLRLPMIRVPKGVPDAVNSKNIHNNYYWVVIVEPLWTSWLHLADPQQLMVSVPVLVRETCGDGPQAGCNRDPRGDCRGCVPIDWNPQVLFKAW